MNASHREEAKKRMKTRRTEPNPTAPLWAHCSTSGLHPFQIEFPPFASSSAPSRLRGRFVFFALLTILVTCTTAHARGPTIVVGAKIFPESAILQQVATQSLKSAGIDATAGHALGGTAPNWAALNSGDIDVYPEYTGSIPELLVNGGAKMSDTEIRVALAKLGIGMTASIGFSDSYVVGMTESRAAALNVRSISDLAAHPELKFAFSPEFVKRPDCWPGLRPAYQLPQSNVQSMLHPLAYRALLTGSVDATDVYSTDADIIANHLRVLDDDRHFFPAYDAVYLYRMNLNTRAPGAVAVLEKLRGRIDVQAMQAMNVRAVIGRVPETDIASQFLNPTATAGTTVGPWNPRTLLRFTEEHLELVATSLLLATLVGIPLGIFAAERPAAGQFITGIIAALYTIPSLALLVFMIPILGTGKIPAIAALFLYSLLPIVRGTLTGLQGITPSLRESAEVLGLSTWTRLRRVSLPLALPSILSGLKTAAVLDIGTATLGGLIGAGGYGDPILIGIEFGFDKSMILSGAVPAAVMALLAQGGFDLLEKFVIPRGIRGGKT